MMKHLESAFLGYFIILFLVTLTSLKIDINIINLGYLIVVLCCFFKLLLIVNLDKR